jgi:hypothetical protein
MKLTKTFLSLALALALFAAACGSDDDGGDVATDESSTTTSEATEDPTEEAAEASTTTTTEAAPEEESTTTTTEVAELTASWQGVTEDTIELGFILPDYDQLRELGLVDINTGDQQLTVDTLVADLNSRGGILGRQISGTLETVFPLGLAEAEAACVLFTEDIGVFTVIGEFSGPAADANVCFTDLAETIMVGGQPSPEQLEQAKVAWISSNLSAERRLKGAIELMDADGLIGDRVAVAMDASEQDLGDDIVIADLEERGYEVVTRVVQDVPPTDTVAAEEQWGVFIEKFRVDEVDTVVLVESTAVPGANYLVTSDFEAQILVADTGEIMQTLPDYGVATPEQLEGIIGTGGLDPAERLELEETQACIDAFEATNPDIEVLSSSEVPEGEPDWMAGIVRVCVELRLFEYIATAAGADLNPDSFLTAAEGLGPIDLPGQTFSSLAPGKWDADDGLRLLIFDADADVLGRGVPYTDIARIS